MSSDRSRFTALSLAALVALQAVVPLPAAAQSSDLSYEQVKRKFRTMSSVHIKKCDKDGNALYSRAEYNCVQSIYRVLYVAR